ncbi:hypothetical protein [Streptomyces sp. NPDC086766]|uniref:hypothetical protein n=1 Tax=Streptomyces sp. NPDC086766 TaxID=3365754 RepID=UPI0037FF0F53
MAGNGPPGPAGEGGPFPSWSGPSAGVANLDTSGIDDLVAARVGSTSNPHALAALMSVAGEGADQIPALTVICTYDSLDKIEQTQSTGYAVLHFDLAVMDRPGRRPGGFAG